MKGLRFVCLGGKSDQISKGERRQDLEHAGEQLAYPSKPEFEFEGLVQGPKKGILVSASDSLLK